MKVIGENRIADLWDRIKTYVDPKADKIPEVNHGTSDTTFTLTPNIMHIWGEVSSLTLTFPEDTNTVLDEFMFTFTSPSTPTTLTLPATIKWIQEPNIEAGKTYQVSVVNGLAGYLTDDMSMTGDENIIEEITVNGTTVPVVNKVATITSTVNSVTVNGNNYTPDANGLVNLGTISGGEGGTGGEYNVIEGVTFNGTTAPITNKIAAITYTAPTLSKGTTTGSGNAVTDISVSGHTVTLTKGTTFLTSYTETDPTVPAAVKAITATDISNWNNKVSNVQTDWNATSGLAQILNKPTIPAAPGTLNTNNTTAQTVSASEALSGTINLHKVAKTGSYNDLLNKPTIPTALADLTADATHRLVTDTEKSIWNNAGNIYYTNDSWIKDSSNNTVSNYSVITQLDRIIDQNDNVYYCVGVNGNNLIFRTVDEEGAPSAGYKIDVNNNEVLVLSSITYLTSSDIPTLSKGTTTGSGNAVTDISVSGHTITLTKGTEFLTTGASSDDILYDPSVSASTSTIGPGLLTTCLEDIDDALDTKQNTSDKVTSISSSSTNTQYPSALAVYNFGTNLVGQLTTIYSGSGAPASSLGNNGDIYIKVT